MSTMEGWDTPSGWDLPLEGMHQFREVDTYRTDMTSEGRKQEMALKANAMKRSEAKALPATNTVTNFASPIGKLIPNEIPPVQLRRFTIWVRDDGYLILVRPCWV